MQDAGGIDPVLGRLIEAYVEDERHFDAMESHLAQVCLTQPAMRSLWDLIYHGINHFDVDASIRASDASYSDLAVNRLRAVAGALISGSASDVELAARRCLGARPPGV